MNKIFLLTFLCFVIGCSKQEYPRETYTSLITTNAVKAAKMEVEVITPDKKYKRTECPYCKGSGRMTQGDGHSVECPHCYISQEYSGSEPCCEYCLCGENCNCKYPGECLINKHKGWPVQVCDEDKCVVFMPRNDYGEEYNPYKLLPENKKKDKRYDIYRYPLKLDRYGNLVK